MRSFWSLAGAAITATVLFAACGGDVKVDGPAGSQIGSGGAGATGGAGTSTGASTGTGATSSTSSSTPSTTATGPSPSTGTGPTPVCTDCNGACGKVSACFGEDIPCDAFCAQIPPDIWQCICAVDCNQIEACVGGTTTSTGVGGSGGGSFGDCAECANNAAVTTCDGELSNCYGDSQCQSLLECHTDCGWTTDCGNQCDQMYPGGYPEFVQLMSCVVCGDCYGPCSQTPLVQYCFDTGG